MTLIIEQTNTDFNICDIHECGPG